MSKSIKKALSVLLCAVLLFGAAPLNGFVGLHFPKLSSLFATEAQAADPTSGTCGENLTWTYDTSTATLTISGTGAMSSYSYSGSYMTTAPWRPYYKTMKTLVVNSGVTSIGDYVFSGCRGLTSVTIGDGVTSIGGYAFRNCTGLTSVTIPDSVTSIGGYAFRNCTGLTSVTIPDSVTSIGDDAFYECTGLTSVTIGNSVTSIGNYAFAYCRGLTSVTIPDSVTSIGNYAFAYCRGLTSVTIPDSVTSIGNYAFRECTGLTSVTIGNSVTSIGDSAFRGCTDLTSVTIGNSVTSIGSSAFSGCTGLTSVTIPDSVTSIGSSAFSGCTSLTSVTIPNSVTSIGSGAFEYCTEMKNVTIGSGVSIIGDYAFFDCTALTQINYNAVSVSDFTSSSRVFENAGTKETGIDVVFGGSVKKIPAYLFISAINRPSPKIKSVAIGNSVTSIGAGAFHGCDNLTNITFPDSVISIGKRAFYECTGLTRVNIGNHVNNIGVQAFQHCTGLTSVTISDSVTSIGDGAFSGCDKLTSITIGNHVNDIGCAAFSSCEGLTSVIIPDSVTSIGEQAFIWCSGLTSVTIGNSVTSIGTLTFYLCTGLMSVTIPNSVTSIGGEAFYGCDGLKEVYYTGNEEQWSKISISSNNKSLLNATIHYNSTSSTDYNVIAPDGTTISILHSESTHHTNEEFPISGELYSPNGTNGITLEWTVSDSNGLSLNLPASMQNTDANHIIFSVLATGKKEGNYTVTVATSNGASAIRKVVIGDIHAEEFDPASTSGIYQINGRLENYGVSTNINTGHSYTSTIKINGKWYNVSKDLISEEIAKQMKGKDVICNFDSRIKEITGISKCKDFSDLNSSDIDNIKNTNGKRIGVRIDNEYRWVRGKFYKDGGSTAVGSIPFQISVYNSIPSEYFDLSDSCKKDSAFIIEISNITISGKSNCGEIRLYDNSFPKTIKLGESLYLNGDILLPSDFWLGYEDSEKIISAEYEIQLKSGERIKNTFQTVVKNRDSKIVTGNENNTLTDAANKLKRTPTSAISLDGLSEIGFSLPQINYLEKLVLVELSLYTIPGDSLEEYVNKKVMEKIFGAKNAVGVKSGKMTIVIPAKYQGRDIQVDIVCDITDYTLLDRTFGNFTNLTYHAYDIKKNGKREKYAFKDGVAGLSVSANVEEFAKAATDLAMGEIKTASKTALSGYEEVERMIFGDTALKILSAAGYNSAFDLGWDLYVNECKKLTYKCPVDIYVYDKDDHLCGAIVNDMVTLNASDAVDLEVTNDEKSVTLWEDGYYIKTLSDCSGTLNISISEKGYVNGIVRALTFENLPLEIGTIYQQGCGTGYYDDQEAYAVEQLNGDTIQATTDTLCIEALEKFTVIYNANDGIVPESSKTVCEGEYVILPTATREGYRFLGWSTSNDNTSDFESGSALEMTANVTLYAVWQKNETPAKPAVKSVALNDVTVNYKAKTTLKPQITADDGAKYTVSYSSSNPNVAKVDANGSVTGAKKGTATITCTVTDEYGNTVTDTCKVTVKYTVWQWIIIILLFGWIWY